MHTLLKSLAFRIGASVVAIEVIVLVAIGAVAVDRLSQEMEGRTRDRITVPGALMERGVLAYESVADREIMGHLIGQELEEGMVVGASGNVFHALDPERLGRDVRTVPGVDPAWFNPRSREPTVVRVERGDDTALVAVTPLFVHGAEVPSLFAYIKVNTTALTRQKLDLVTNVVLLSLACVALTSAIIVLMLRLTVLKRIGGLAGFVRRIGDGDQDVPALAVGDDELGVLEGGVNRMAADLDHRARQRDRAEDELRRSEERFRDFAASASDWYWELDAELRCVAVSERFFVLVGPGRSPIGRPMDGLGVDSLDPDGWTRLNDRLARREPVKDFDVTWREAPDGSGERQQRFARLSGLPVFDRNGRFTGYRGTGRDITMHQQARSLLERRVEERTAALTRANADLQSTLERLHSARSELVRSEKLASLGALVAGVAHEINTPVGVAVTAASHLADRTQSVRERFDANALKRADLAQYLDTAEEAGRLLLSNMERASGLIQSFKQVATDRTSEQLRPYALRRYLEDIVTSLSPTLRKTPHRIAIDCPEGIEMVGYPGLLSQVVTNLVMNSLVHAFAEGQEGRLALGAREEAGTVEIVYEDDGRGIPPEHLGKIFDPFFTTRRGSGSSGLGLNIVHNIVTGTLRGTVAVDSRPGAGVRFTLRVPRVLQERAEAAD